MRLIGAATFIYALVTAFVLSVASGNWEHLGMPGEFGPDRLLFVAGVGSVVLRAPPVRETSVVYV